MTQPGIKSLVGRLETVEKQLEIQPENNFYGNLKKSVKSKKKAKKEKELEDIQKHYDLGLKNNVKDISFSMFSYVAEYTVRYIENNIDKIAKILNVDVSSDLKLQTALSFILCYFNDLDSEFIINSINQMVMLIFNRDKIDKKIEEVKHKKSKFGSIRKIGSKLIP